jgi:serine/threonine-protein kinase
MALHERGYIHRDIDPSNIMITIDNKIKLIDFGVCKHIESISIQEKSLTQAGSFIGKVNYAAPELALGDVSHQNRTTDIYALGILMYQLMVGRLPFVGTNQEVLSAHISKKIPLSDITNKDLRRIIEKATQKKQDKRYATAAELIVDLEHIQHTGSFGGYTSHSTSFPSRQDDSEDRLLVSVLIWLGIIIGGLASGVLLKFLLG